MTDQTKAEIENLPYKKKKKLNGHFVYILKFRQ